MTVTASASTELFYGLTVDTVSLIARARAFGPYKSAVIALGIARNRAKVGTLQCEKAGKCIGDLPSEVHRQIAMAVFDDLASYYEGKEHVNSLPRAVACLCPEWPCQRVYCSGFFQWSPNLEKAVKEYLNAHGLQLARRPSSGDTKGIGACLIAIKTRLEGKKSKQPGKTLNGASVQATYKYSPPYFDSEGFFSDGSADSMGVHEAQVTSEASRVRVMASWRETFHAEQQILHFIKRYSIRGDGWKGAA